MISEKQRVLPDIPGRTRSRHRKVRSTPGPPQSTAFPHGTGVRKTAPPPWKIHGREDGWSAVHRILHGTDRPLLPAPTHESAHSPHTIFLPGLTQNPGSHRPGPA